MRCAAGFSSYIYYVPLSFNINRQKLIELSEEDLKFKESAEYPGSENLVLAAIALETTEYVRTKYGQNLMFGYRITTIQVQVEPEFRIIRSK